MRRSLVQLYALAVCFCTLMCLVVALGIGIYDVIQIAAPEFTMASQWQSQAYLYEDANARNNPELRELPREEIARRRDEANRQAMWWERRNAIQSLIFVAIIVALDAIVLLIHWWIVRRERRFTAAPRAPVPPDWPARSGRC